ncbi:hypothetical protein LSO9J_10066 [Candidatus Liberibacter solanacearum]
MIQSDQNKTISIHAGFYYRSIDAQMSTLLNYVITAILRFSRNDFSINFFLKARASSLIIAFYL